MRIINLKLLQQHLTFNSFIEKVYAKELFHILGIHQMAIKSGNTTSAVKWVSGWCRRVINSIYHAQLQGRGGRVVKAFDSKSNGIFPHRFESCPRRYVFAFVLWLFTLFCHFLPFLYVSQSFPAFHFYSELQLSQKSIITITGQHINGPFLAADSISMASKS